MEISQSLQTAKQLLGKEVEVTMDRPLGSKHPKHDFVYEANYGFIEGIKAPDGEDLDSYFFHNQRITKVCITYTYIVTI
ncbi:MAG: hypothetical protein COV33_00095 [Candidatus Zambryskibacteria bacterium CG10_big_fil_rev_8_21_14_0_10_34_34]|uniref:Inorganic pyrophosphatase n=1 Tax=Candidatus Zambryskibacteria bacterium CG10_big_fil_rev_8_21_14_0_10_34_34 TaxID=1975114 RepID=A0A2H0R1H0_9BACT|nr:MAG: hypothetical protein COV33_00095 [Candidatus Zambryskibacteria bacterium CG10_big_fil_rev_8_21_14_0_10_34_34]